MVLNQISNTLGRVYICMCAFIYQPINLSISPFIYLFIYLSICLSTYLYLEICATISIYLCLYLHIYICIYTLLNLYLSFYLSLYITRVKLYYFQIEQFKVWRKTNHILHFGNNVILL